MRFSLNFIKEFLEVKTPPQKLASLLTMAGMEVEHFEKVSDDWVFDIEVTSNRYDWLSILGIAREISAVLGKKLKVNYPPRIKEPTFKGKNIIIEDKKDCPYYLGRFLSDVTVNNSPKCLVELILNCGVSSVKDVVDITNYCMLKWGNPLHAFDADKIEGEVYIRRANKGESFVGIDGKGRTLGRENLVIADAKKVIALAGVMGAKNTEVSASTKNIFLEAAIFSPVTVRCSRRAAGLETDSSYRFERMVSADYLEYASFEAAQLIAKSGKAKLISLLKAGAKPHFPKKKIALDLSLVSAYLGGSFSKGTVKKILESLGCDVKSTSQNKLNVFVPFWRFDLKEKVDLYEEFARVYGYDKISGRIPSLAHYAQKDPKGSPEELYRFKNELAALITLLRFKEVINYSLESQEELDRIGQKESIKVSNPLRTQENALRPSLLLGMLKTIRHNLNRNQNVLCFFEIADIYLREKDGFLEKPFLAMAISGKEDTFFYLKGAVEEILTYLNIGNLVKFPETSIANFTNALQVIAKDKDFGFIGKLDEAQKKYFGLKEDVFFAQLDVCALMECRSQKRYQVFSPYPVIWRDLSIILQNTIKFKEIEKIIKEQGSYLTDMKIVDIYEGKDIPPESRAFTVRIFYQSKEKTLTSQEVDSSHANIRQMLSQHSGIQLR